MGSRSRVRDEDDESSARHRSKVVRRRDAGLDRFDGTGHEVRRARDLAKNLFDKGEDAEIAIERDPQRFRENLSYIIRSNRTTLRELADEAKVEYRWLRRIVRDGLERRVGRLDRLAQTLRLPDGDYFWAPDIRRFLPPPPDPEELCGLKRRLNWAYAERLLDLLETGDHEYLKGLIDRLHEACSVQRDRGVNPGEEALDRDLDSGPRTPGNSSEPAGPITESPVAVPDPDPGVPPLARRTRGRSKSI